MTTAPTPSRALAALVTGVATAAYYATPDVIASRAARGWAKAGLTAVTVAAAVPDVRAARAAARRQRELAGASSSDLLAPTVVRHRAVLAGGAAAALAGTVAVVVVGERWIFRRGQARAAAGARLPHTRTGLLLGALAAGLTLVPSPPDPTDPSAPSAPSAPSVSGGS